MATFLRFGCFEVDLAAGLLYKRGTRVPLREQAFQVLAALLERPGQVVTRDHLRHRLWPDGVFVDYDNILNSSIARLRDALGDSVDHPRFIETLPKRGYRFIGAVSETPAAPGADGRRDPATGADRDAKRPTADVVAYNEYVQGLYHLDRMIMGARCYEKARAHLENAIARDPGFALAHEALAQVCWITGYAGLVAPAEAFASGILHAVRALEIDGTRAEPHALIAQFHKQHDYRWADVHRELAIALETNPTSHLVRMLHAVGWLMPQGRLDEAIAELERTLEWDPLSYQLRFWLAIMFSLARQPDRVIEQARLLIEMEPAGPNGWWLLGVGSSRKGLLDESVEALQSAVNHSGESAMMLGWFGLVLASGGRTDEARDALARLQAKSRTAYVPPASFAWVYLGLRDVDRAFEWLDRAVDAHDQLMMPIKTYAFFDPIRADPRFHALLRKMSLNAD